MTYPTEEVTVYVKQNGSQRLLREYSPITLLQWSQMTLERLDHNGEYWHLTNANSEEMIDAAIELECNASASYITWEIVAVEEARQAAREAREAAQEAAWEAWEAWEAARVAREAAWEAADAAWGAWAAANEEWEAAWDEDEAAQKKWDAAAAS